MAWGLEIRIVTALIGGCHPVGVIGGNNRYRNHLQGGVTVISLQHQYESYFFNLRGVCFNAVTVTPTRSLWAPQACGHRRCACQVLGNSWKPVARQKVDGF